MAQILVPTSDQATGSWTSTPLWSKVDDDSSVNPTGDGTEITSADNISPDNADFKISSGSDPGVDTGHVLRARWRKSGTGGHSITRTLELWQGVPDTGTLIDTMTLVSDSATEVETTRTLATSAAANITDYTGLYLRLARVGDTGGSPGNRRSLVADLVEFEIPDAAVVVTPSATAMPFVSVTTTLTIGVTPSAIVSPYIVSTTTLTFGVASNATVFTFTSPAASTFLNPNPTPAAFAFTSPDITQALSLAPVATEIPFAVPTASLTFGVASSASTFAFSSPTVTLFTGIAVTPTSIAMPFASTTAIAQFGVFCAVAVFSFTSPNLSILTDTTIVPDSVAFSFAGVAPQLTFSLVATSNTFAFTAPDATAIAGAGVNPNANTFTFASPSVTLAHEVTPSAASFTYATPNVTLATGTIVVVNVVPFALSSAIPVVSFAATPSPTVTSISAAELNAVFGVATDSISVNFDVPVVQLPVILQPGSVGTSFDATDLTIVFEALPTSNTFTWATPTAVLIVGDSLIAPSVLSLVFGVLNLEASNRNAVLVYTTDISAVTHNTNISLVTHLVNVKNKTLSGTV